MTDARRSPISSASRLEDDRLPASYTSEVSWTGWVTFAGVMMILLGLFQVVEGLVALLRPSYFVVSNEGLLVPVTYAGWGWLHLVLGVVIALAGGGVLAGNAMARVVGVVLAGLSALANLAFIAAYPLWGVIVIALDIAVIYALCTDPRGRYDTPNTAPGPGRR
jgi:hypothetical protein